MDIQTVSALASSLDLTAEDIPGDQASLSRTAPAATPFGQLVADGLQQTNQKLIEGQMTLQKLAMGEVQNLHQVMIGLEESRVAFQLMLQVRGRLLESYQEVMRMQI